MEVSLQLPYYHLPYLFLGIKITATQTFGLCDCSEDDTISLQTWYLFGDIGRFLLAQGPVLLFYSISSISNEYPRTSPTSVHFPFKVTVSPFDIEDTLDF